MNVYIFLLYIANFLPQLKHRLLNQSTFRYLSHTSNTNTDHDINMYMLFYLAVRSHVLSISVRFIIIPHTKYSVAFGFEVWYELRFVLSQITSFGIQ